jgi:hypothetical protein
VGRFPALATAPKSCATVTIGVGEMLTGASKYYGQTALKAIDLTTSYLKLDSGAHPGDRHRRSTSGPDRAAEPQVRG